MKFLLHVGTHKTGTTTIQEFCAGNRSRLAARGLVYPDLRDVGSQNGVSHHDLAAAPSSTPKRLSSETVRGLIDKLAARAKPEELVLLSAESIYRHVAPGFDRADFWQGHECYLRNLAKLFGNHQVEVIIVFRRYDNFAESLFQENVRTRGYSKSFDVFLEEREYNFQYRKHVEILKDVFCSLKILEFGSLSKGDLTHNFLFALGVDFLDLAKIKRKNESLPKQYVLFQQEINGLLERGEQRKLGGRLAEIVSVTDDEFAPISFFAADRKQSFLTRFEDDNRWLGKEVYGRDEDFFCFPVVKSAGRNQLTRDERNLITARLVEEEFRETGRRRRSCSRRLRDCIRATGEKTFDRTVSLFAGLWAIWANRRRRDA